MTKLITGNKLELGKTYISKQPLYYGDINDVIDSQAKWLKEHGYVEEDNSIVFPIGTKVTHTGHAGGAEEFMVEDMQFDFYFTEDTLFEEAEKPVTNREKLSNMTNEELAEFINEAAHDACLNCCAYREIPCCHRPCVDGILVWLNAEVE